MKRRVISVPDGLVEACFDTYVHRYLKFIHDTSIEPFTDYFSENLANLLINFGVEVITPTMGKENKRSGLTDKATSFVRYMRKCAPDSKAMFVDSGGFQILGGQVPLSNMTHLADMYTTFISDVKDIKNTYYFYLDVNVIGGISPDFSIKSMLDFQSKLEDKTKDNDQKSNIYLVYHCNTPIAYKTFLNYFDTYHIPERLGSHRYAVGGMVPLNFNNEKLQMKTYMYPLFEVIERERSYLDKGGHVYYHILGTSGFYEEFLILWCKSYFKQLGWNLHISFDSSTALSLAVRSSLLYHISDSDMITQFTPKYNTLHQKPYNKQSDVHENAWYLKKMLNKIKANLPMDPIYKLDDVSDCYEPTDNGKMRYTMPFTLSCVIYSYWACAEIYRIFEKSVMSHSELVTDNGSARFDHMVSHIEQYATIKNMNTFNKRTYRSLDKSFEYLKLFVEKKIDITSIRNMGIQDVTENIEKLAYKDEIRLF